MQFLRKKLETFRHHRSSDDEDDVPPVHHASSKHRHHDSKKTRGSGGGGNKDGVNNKADGPVVVVGANNHVLRSNNGYASGDLSRSTPKQSNICGVTFGGNGKPLFAGQQQQQQYSTWPDDEFNDGPTAYVDPSQQDEYDSPDEPDHGNIGQTGFFGNESSCSSSGGAGGGGDEPVLPPPLQHPQQHQTHSPKSSAGIVKHNSLEVPSAPSGGAGGKLLVQRTASSAVSQTKQHEMNKACSLLPNRGAPSSGPSSNNVNRSNNSESVNRRASAGAAISTATAINNNQQNSQTVSPVSSSSADENSAGSLTQQPPAQRLPLQLRSQPKILGSRFCEGLDPNKVVTGIQAMVKMNQPGSKVPPTPPKPSNFKMPLLNDVTRSRFVPPPPTVTPPDSDECEPELPSRLKSMILANNNNSDTGGPASPSPPSSEASSGPIVTAPKKRQAPPPPPNKTGQSGKPANVDAPLPAPVPDFKVVESGNNSSNQTPSIASSSDGSNCDDLLPPMMPPQALINKPDPISALKQRERLTHTSSNPITVSSSNTTNTISASSAFANRLSNTSTSNSNSSTSGVSSLQSSASSSTSASSIKLPTNNNNVNTNNNNKVLIKVPTVSRPLDVASTSFTSGNNVAKLGSNLLAKNGTNSALQVTVVSTGGNNNNNYQENTGYAGSTSTGTGTFYTSDEEVYTGAESLQYNLFTFEWYHGKMTREESERRLRENGQEGAFLVRDCNNAASQPNALFTLCLFARNACHYIQVCRRPEANDRLAVGSQKDSEKTFATIQELVQFHMNEAPLVVQPRPSHAEAHPQQFLCSLKHPIARRD